MNAYPELDDIGYERLAIRLYRELVVLRAKARGLPVDAIERWQLSLRAVEIGKDLKVITDKVRRPQ